VNAEIVAVGTELLLGDIVNTNAQFLAQELAAMGIGVHFQSVVGDNPDRLRQTLELALGRADLVITSGGLGPTDDDLTKQTICRALGVELYEDKRAREMLEAHFGKTGRVITPNNYKQVMLPQGCVPFYNEFGTAPGCAVEKDGKVVMMLPGPPREIVPMFLKDGREFLARYGDGVIVSTNLREYGIGESALEPMVQEFLDGANPTTALYAKEGEVLIRVTAKEKDRETANKMCRITVNNIKAVLGDVVYGENVDSLEQVVVGLLKEQGKTLATAESCTGGLLSMRLTRIPGASAVFEYGVCTYANRIKAKMLHVPEAVLEQFGAVSPQTALAMARGVREEGGADLGVSITGIAGPEGGTPEKPVGLVYVALCDGENAWVKELRLHRSGREREYIRSLAAMQALDLVRRRLCGFPLIGAKSGEDYER
jgi:nicotinamide-nucleotide amidase